MAQAIDLTCAACLMRGVRASEKHASNISRHWKMPWKRVAVLN